MSEALFKLHLYVVEVPGYTYRVLKLRPSDSLRLSNNYFHETWHLLVGPEGVGRLSQLLWGMAYQRHPGTLLMIDAPHLTPTPFEADAPLPCIIAQAGLARMDDDLLRAMRRKLSQMKSPTATVRWRTFGMEEGEALWAGLRWRYREQEVLSRQEKMSRLGGVICYTAPPLLLRSQALAVSRLGRYLFYGSSYTYLAEGNWRRREHPSGEVQVFGDFADRVGAAVVARGQLLGAEAKISDDQTRERVWRKTEQLTKARLVARRGRGRARQQREAEAR